MVVVWCVLGLVSFWCHLVVRVVRVFFLVRERERRSVWWVGRFADVALGNGGIVTSVCLPVSLSLCLGSAPLLGIRLAWQIGDRWVHVIELR